MTVLLLGVWPERAMGLPEHYIDPFLFLAGLLLLPAILIYTLTLTYKKTYDYWHMTSGQHLMSVTTITPLLTTQTLQLPGMHLI
ncbi:hypothetical protein D3C71_90210 [compost metagenome]